MIFSSGSNDAGSRNELCFQKVRKGCHILSRESIVAAAVPAKKPSVVTKVSQPEMLTQPTKKLCDIST